MQRDKQITKIYMREKSGLLAINVYFCSHIFKLLIYKTELMNSSHQSLLFENLLKTLSRPQLIHIIRSVLSVSKTTAYKYLNEDSDISYNEMQRLLDHDLIVSIVNNPNKSFNPSRIEWKYLPLEFDTIDPAIFLNRLHDYVSLLEPAKANILLSTFEVPLFYYMGFPRLFSFKLYCWSQTIWQCMGRNWKFNPDYLEAEKLTELVKNIYRKFLLIPSVEYWTESILDNTIRQIGYFRDMDAFTSRKHYIELVEDMNSLIEYIGDMLDSQKKLNRTENTEGGKLSIALNQIYFTSNIYLIESLTHKMVFTSCDNPNFLITNNKQMFRHLKEWHKSMQDNSTPLTGNTTLVKKNYLETLRMKLEELA